MLHVAVRLGYAVLHRDRTRTPAWLRVICLFDWPHHGVQPAAPCIPSLLSYPTMSTHAVLRPTGFTAKYDATSLLPQDIPGPSAAIHLTKFTHCKIRSMIGRNQCCKRLRHASSCLQRGGPSRIPEVRGVATRPFGAQHAAACAPNFYPVIVTPSRGCLQSFRT